MPCLAPSEVVDSATAARVGSIAERFIADEYLVFRGRRGFFPAPGSDQDFSDIHAGFARTTLFIGFLKAHNPPLRTSELLKLRALTGLLRVPDLATHDRLITEFYEIKPKSPDGLAAGFAKIAALDALFSFFSLPYRPGVRFAASRKFEIARGLILDCEVRIQLHFFLHAPGLILYDLCVEGELNKLAGKIGVGVMLATTIVVLLTVGPKLAPA
jgi:hypothetical protein